MGFRVTILSKCCVYELLIVLLPLICLVICPACYLFLYLKEYATKSSQLEMVHEHLIETYILDSWYKLSVNVSQS